MRVAVGQCETINQPGPGIVVFDQWLTDNLSRRFIGFRNKQVFIDGFTRAHWQVFLGSCSNLGFGFRQVALGGGTTGKNKAQQGQKKA